MHSKNLVIPFLSIFQFSLTVTNIRYTYGSLLAQVGRVLSTTNIGLTGTIFNFRVSILFHKSQIKQNKLIKTPMINR